MWKMSTWNALKANWNFINSKIIAFDWCITMLVKSRRVERSSVCSAASPPLVPRHLLKVKRFTFPTEKKTTKKQMKFPKLRVKWRTSSGRRSFVGYCEHWDPTVRCSSVTELITAGWCRWYWGRCVHVEKTSTWWWASQVDLTWWEGITVLVHEAGRCLLIHLVILFSVNGVDDAGGHGRDASDRGHFLTVEGDKLQWDAWYSKWRAPTLFKENVKSPNQERGANVL